MNITKDKPYWHTFNLIGQFGPIRIQRLLKYFKELQIAWQANKKELLCAGIEEKIIDNFFINKKNIDVEREWQSIEQDYIVLILPEKKYPRILKEIHYAPFILYIRGSIDILSGHSLAVVGTRRMSEYGKQVTEELTYSLTQSGLTIVSGLASGIDTIAHSVCLENQGKTIAVLGSGIDDTCIFPGENRKLVKKIINNNGAIISEYPPLMKAQRQFFPARNRIISGLSLGTIVIEAAEKSGALITAYLALEQNREVFAVPGSIFNSRSTGCHNLIKKGAKLVINHQDILEELPEISCSNSPLKIKLAPSLQNVSHNEKQIIELLSQEPQHIDKIMKSCRLTTSQVLTTLTMLELKGIIKSISTNNYILCPSI